MWTTVAWLLCVIVAFRAGKGYRRFTYRCGYQHGYDDGYGHAIEDKRDAAEDRSWPH